MLQFYYTCEKVFSGPLREVTLYQHTEQLGAQDIAELEITDLLSGCTSQIIKTTCIF
jgi:hypothetical protein